MYIALISKSQDTAVRPALNRIALACEKQLYEHYGPFWQADGMNVRVASPTDAILQDPNCAPLIIYDTPGQGEDGVLGYHTYSPGKIMGKIFWTVIAKSGGTLMQGENSLSVTVSHEILEAVVDPYASWWADLDDVTQESLEASDRVEGDSYDIDGVSVSNFLGPRAFRPGPGPYDWMNLLTSPWEIRKGGYAIRRKTGAGGGKVYNVWGEAYPEEKKALKDVSVPGSRAARRQARLDASAAVGDDASREAVASES